MGRMLPLEKALADSHSALQMLPGDKAVSALRVFHRALGSDSRWPQGLPAHSRGHWQRLPGVALKRRPPYPADSSSLEVPMLGCWRPGLAVATRAAESLEVVGESLRGLSRVTGVSEGLRPVVERAGASVRAVAGRAGSLDAVWAPEAEDEGSGVTGGGPGAPGEAGGRVEAPGETAGPGEGPTGGKGEVWAPGGLRGTVCMSDTFVLRRSWRKRGAGL